MLSRVYIHQRVAPRSSIRPDYLQSRTRSVIHNRFSLPSQQQRFISINKVTLLGNVGGPPQLKAFEVTETYKDRRTNSKVERTDWFRVNVYNPHHQELVQKYVSKGTKVYVEGSLRVNKWKDALGQEKSTVDIQLKGPKAEIILLGGKKTEGFGGFPENETMFGDPDEPVRSTEGAQPEFNDFPDPDDSYQNQGKFTGF